MGRFFFGSSSSPISRSGDPPCCSAAAFSRAVPAGRRRRRGASDGENLERLLRQGERAGIGRRAALQVRHAISCASRGFGARARVVRQGSGRASFWGAPCVHDTQMNIFDSCRKSGSSAVARTPFDLQGLAARADWRPRTRCRPSSAPWRLSHHARAGWGVTRDGVVVVGTIRPSTPTSHGARTASGSRRTDPRSTASRMTRSRATTWGLKPGSVYAGRYPAQVAADGARMPRLSDVFDLVQRSGNRRVRFTSRPSYRRTLPTNARPRPFARALIAEIRRADASRNSATTNRSDWRTLQV